MPTLSPHTLERVRLALESWQARFGGKLSFFVENHKLSDIARTENAAVLLALELSRVAETAASEMSFTAQEILADPAAVAEKVDLLKELQAVAAEPEIQAAVARCRDAVSQAAEQIGARDKVQPALADKVVGGLIYSAEKEMGALRVHQYAQGGTRGTFHLNQWLFAFPTMHELVCALARQPVDGLTLCVVLDPEIPEYSIFAWALKTGHTLTVLSEDNGLSHRGQKHSRRNPGRDFERRSSGRHYPYSIFEFEETATAAGTGCQWRIKGMFKEGVALAEGDNAITTHSLAAHRIRRISDLEPEEITWILLMALQIHGQYWLRGKRTTELAYTGEMVDNPAAVPQALLETGSSAGLLMPPDFTSATMASPLGEYAPLTLQPLSQEHMQQTGEDGKSWEGPGDGRTGRNDWMVHRFSGRANYDAVAQSEQVRLALPQAEHQEDAGFFERCARKAKGEPEMPLRPVVALDREGKLTTHTPILDRGGWNNGKPVTYQVAPFKPEGLYGTRVEIERERFYIARRNEATAIQALADQEYAEQGESILRWFQQRVVSNVEALKRAIAAETCEVLTRFDDPKSGGSSFTNRVTVRPYNILRLYGIVDKEKPGGMTRYAADLHSGITKRDDWKYQCIEDPAIIGRCTAVFSPVDASGIAFLAGVPVSELPDYLQHWRHSNYSLGYTGNSILNLVDPVEKLRNPWTQLNFSVQVHFSKVALNRWRRGLFRANPALAVTLYPQREPNEFLGLFAQRITPPLRKH